MNEINREIADLWATWAPRVPALVRAPMMFGELKTSVPLFVGFNPSWSPQERKLFERSNPGQRADDFISWARAANDPYYVEQASTFQKLCKDTLAFFQPFRDMSAKVGSSWEHVDLFLFRETKQKGAIIEYVLMPDNSPTEFGWVQLSIFERILVALQPSAIIFANRQGSSIARSLFADRLRTDNQGIFLELRKGALIPILFTCFPGRWHTRTFCAETREFFARNNESLSR
jgi:hypothetical protein